MSLNGKGAMLVAAACVALSASVGLTPAARASGPQIVQVTPINGNLQSYMPGVGIAANLDTTPLVAGLTRYDPDGPGPHLIFNDTSAGFLWQGAPAGAQGPIPGHMHIFYISPPSLYYTPSRYVPTGIDANGGTVVGSVAFPESYTTQPWQWTAANGLTFLPLPGSGWQGSAGGISSDGTVVAGTVYQRIGFRTTSSAAEWVNGSLNVLGAPGTWSQTAAQISTSGGSGISSDGTVIVGSSGPGASSAQAARWVNGQQAPMDPAGTLSTALFTSADGSTAVGTATISPALTDLVLWDANGTAKVLTPPNGYSVDQIRAINPTATAVVGSLVTYPNCTPGGPGPICNGDQVPFLWTAADGFTIMPVNGMPDYYNMSTAVGVSHDGTKVVGTLSPGVQYPGSPPPLAFVWTRSTGEIMLNTLAQQSGYNNLSNLFGVDAISGSGNRIIAVGAPPATVHDTAAVILDVSGLG